MSRNAVPEAVSTLVEPVAREHGLELIDVEFRPQGRRSVLRLVLDRDGGVGLDELSLVSREVSDLLDVHDVVPCAYVLECSSPGINRPLRKAEDFARFVGKAVRIRTHASIAGSRNFSGRLAASSDDAIEIEDASHGRVTVPLAEIERANYQHDFAEEFRARRS
ncbi:MAG TPA: ribosome maturation factor RimP [Candidatus Binatia bacterium]|nr:ribosome maturation factor RimP [Candidatus Binatia bacterium]